MQILICDDHRLLAELLGKVLTAHGHDVVVSTDPEEAVELAERRAVDVCIMDLGFRSDPSEPGDAPSIRSIRLLQEVGTPVVVLTGSSDARSQQQAVEAGASDLLLKGEPIDAVVEAVETAAHGGSRRPDLHPGAPVSPRPEWSYASLAGFLTPRERAVLEGLVNGESTTALAERLGVRPATARTHVQNLLGKLCVHTRLEAVSLAVTHGIVEPPGQSG